jgi:hypothetical protein
MRSFRCGGSKSQHFGFQASNSSWPHDPTHHVGLGVNEGNFVMDPQESQEVKTIHFCGWTLELQVCSAHADVNLSFSI